jgi:hypothetical protein
MGLDMYLYAEINVMNASAEMVEQFPQYAKDRETYFILNKIVGENLPTAEFGGISIAKCVGYWRKANAIHGWIVRECAGGVDECQRIYISREKLTELRDLCVNALANRDTATPAVDKTISIDLEASEDKVPLAIMSEIMRQRDNINSTAVIDDPLAPTSGFFFGSTEKDEWYYKDLEHTIGIINSLIANDDDWSYYYQASW